MKKLIFNVAFFTGAMLGALWLPVEYYYFDGSAEPNLYWFILIPALAALVTLIYVSIVIITIFLWGIINDL